MIGLGMFSGEMIASDLECALRLLFDPFKELVIRFKHTV